MAGLSEIKQNLEKPMEKIFEIYIRTTPERLWQAIIDPEIRSKYHFGASVTSDWTPGARLEFGHPGAPGLLGEGEVLEADPPRRLVHTLTSLWSDEVKSAGASRVTWEIEQVADSDSCLILTHDQLPENASDQIYGGWPMILSGLKTWLETGELLTTPGSLMYSDGADPSRETETPRWQHRPRRPHRRRPHDRRAGTRPGHGTRVLHGRTRLREEAGCQHGERRVRWIEVAPAGARTSLALVLEHDGVPAGVETGIRLTTADADADHRALVARGVDVGEVLRWPGVPPMFAFRDQDGNGLEIVQEA